MDEEDDVKKKHNADFKTIRKIAHARIMTGALIRHERKRKIQWTTAEGSAREHRQIDREKTASTSAPFARLHLILGRCSVYFPSLFFIISVVIARHRRMNANRRRQLSFRHGRAQ